MASWTSTNPYPDDSSNSSNVYLSMNEFLTIMNHYQGDLHIGDAPHGGQADPIYNGRYFELWRYTLPASSAGTTTHVKFAVANTTASFNPCLYVHTSPPVPGTVKSNGDSTMLSAASNFDANPSGLWSYSSPSATPKQYNPLVMLKTPATATSTSTTACSNYDETVYEWNQTVTSTTASSVTFYIRVTNNADSTSGCTQCGSCTVPSTTTCPLGGYLLKSDVPLTPYTWTGTSYPQYQASVDATPLYPVDKNGNRLVDDYGNPVPQLGAIPFAQMRLQTTLTARAGIIQNTFDQVRYGFAIFNGSSNNDGRILVGLEKHERGRPDKHVPRDVHCGRRVPVRYRCPICLTTPRSGRIMARQRARHSCRWECQLRAREIH